MQGQNESIGSKLRRLETLTHEILDDQEAIANDQQALAAKENQLLTMVNEFRQVFSGGQPQNYNPADDLTEAERADRIRNREKRRTERLTRQKATSGT